MKKFLSLFLSIILVLSVVPAFQVVALGKPTFVISNATAEVGDTVEIEISTKNNPGVISLQVCVEYDSKALKLIDHKEGDFDGVTFGPKTKVPFIATWIDPLKPNNDTNGVIVKLQFEVLDTAPNGKSEISVTYDPENVFEYNTSAKDNFKNVDFEVKNGYVDIKNPDGPKETESSQESDSSDSTQSVVASVDEETNNVYEEIIDELLSSPDNLKPDDDTTTTGNVSGGTSNNKNENTNNDSTNGWLIWVVVAAVVALGSAFAIVILKSKKSKH